MSQAMRSVIALKYNDVDVPRNVTDECESFTFEDNAYGQADSIELSMDNRTGKWMKSWHPHANDFLKAWIKVQDWQQGKRNAKLFCGKFTIDEIVYSGFPQTVQLRGISIPINGGFNVTERNRTWKKTTTKQILSDIAKAAGIKLVYDAEAFSIDEITQSGNTDMEFAFSVCEDYDLALKLYNDRLVVYDKTAYEKKKHAYTISKDDIGDNYSIKEQIRTVYDSVKMQYTSGGKTVTYEYTVPGKKGVRRMFISEKADSIRDAEQRAKARLRENLRETRTIDLTVMGNIRYKAAENFMLEGFGKLDGKYFVDHVSHRKSNSKYTCQITAHKVVTEF